MFSVDTVIFLNKAFNWPFLPELQLAVRLTGFWSCLLDFLWCASEDCREHNQPLVCSYMFWCLFTSNFCFWSGEVHNHISNSFHPSKLTSFIPVLPLNCWLLLNSLRLKTERLLYLNLPERENEVYIRTHLALLKFHDLIGIYIHFIKGYSGQKAERTASWDNKQTHRLWLVFLASFLLGVR